MSRANFYDFKFVDLLGGAADAAGRSSDIISLRNAGKVELHVKINQGNAATVALAVMQATNVAGAGAKALANPVPIFANLDTASSDTFVRQTDAVSFVTDAGVKQKWVVFEIDPAQLDVNNGYDCVYLTTGASNAANITDAFAIILDPRFASQAPPSAIVD